MNDDARPSRPLQPGTRAPDFALKSTPDQTVSLAELRGGPVILAFYPADWSPVCGDQMSLYNEILAEFRRFGATLLGVSVDGVWCHAAFARDRKLHCPLLSDFEPKGAVALSYGAYRAHEGVSERALFVVDADGVIRWSYVSPVGVTPGAEASSPHSRRCRSKGRGHEGRDGTPTQSACVRPRSRAGSRRRQAHARGVRRLRVPALRARLPDREGGPEAPRHAASVRVPQLSPEQRASKRRGARGSGGGGRGARKVLGDAQAVLCGP